MKTPKSYSIEETFKKSSKTPAFKKAYKARKAKIAKKKLNKNWPEELISTLNIIKKKQLLRKKKK